MPLRTKTGNADLGENFACVGIRSRGLAGGDFFGSDGGLSVYTAFFMRRVHPVFCDLASSCAAAKGYSITPAM